MKKSFLMYADGYETLKYLTDEQLGKLTRMMFEYFLNGNTCDPSDPLFFVFNPIKMQMDRDVEKYSKVLEVRREAGKKGGEAKASKSYQMLPNGKVSLANVADKDTVTVTDTDTVKEKDTEKVKDIYTDSNESNRDQFQSITTLETPPPERKKVAQKKESTNHSFANSKYANNHELFIQDWNNSNGAITFPNADPIRIFETLKNASDANAKYKYSNWLSAAINWVRRNPDEYKRLHITQSGKPLHPVEQRMAETLERLNRNSLNGNADGFGHFTPPSEFGYVP